MRLQPLLVVLIFSSAASSVVAEPYTTGPTSVAPPLVVVANHEPHVKIVPVTRILKVDDPDFEGLGDMFRFAGYWYVYKNRSWYRATGYHGPYYAIDVHLVPQEILFVPAKHWKHPPTVDSPVVAKPRRSTPTAVAAKRSDSTAGSKPTAVVATQRTAVAVTPVPKSSRAAAKPATAPKQVATAEKPASKREAEMVAAVMKADAKHRKEVAERKKEALEAQAKVEKKKQKEAESAAKKALAMKKKEEADKRKQAEAERKRSAQLAKKAEEARRKDAERKKHTLASHKNDPIDRRKDAPAVGKKDTVASRKGTRVAKRHVAASRAADDSADRLAAARTR